MRRTVGLPLAAAALLLLVPQLGLAQVQPHRAEYALRLGGALNAPRIGMAVQELTLECGGWRIKRDIKTEIALTASWKMSIASKLDGQEGRGGSGFRFHTVQNQNGSAREARGRVTREGSETRAEIAVQSATPRQFLLPGPTMMPVEAMNHLIERLGAGAAAFPALTFDAEVIGDAFLVDVTELDPGMLRARRPGDEPVAVPADRSWPVFMSFTRGRHQDQRPLFTVNAMVFNSGVLDRLTVETGLVSVTADLRSLEMLPPAHCPRS
jgi:hypothetical protein